MPDMIRKYFLLFVLFVMVLFPLSAQQQSSHKEFNIEKFKQKRASFMVSEVGLTDAQAKLFVPIINELLDKRFELNRIARHQSRQLRNKKNKSNSDYEMLLNLKFEVRQKELNLEKEYYDKMKKVVSAEKVYKYQLAESKFMKNMIREHRNSKTHK